MLTHRLLWLVTIGVMTTLSTAHGEMAPYRVTFQGLWNAQDHPTNYPSGAHFSPLIGGTHNDTVSFWDVGALASKGIEDVAETGFTGELQNEVNDGINAGRAHSLLLRSQSFGGTQSSTIDFMAESSHPLVTLVTMVAPSPDWFVGVSGLSLLDEQGHWIPEIEVDMFAYDAGTEEGTGFSTSNSDTSPHSVITQLHGSEVDDQFPFLSAPKLATMTFTLVPEPNSMAILISGTALLLRRRRCVRK